MSYPYEAGETEAFTPSSLAKIKNPPVFNLRNGTLREKQRIRRLFIEEGVTQHSIEAIRAETLKGLRALCSDDEYFEWEPLIKSYWDATDCYAKEIASTDGEFEPFEFDGEDKVREVLGLVRREWRPVRVMYADNNEASDMMPMLVMSLIVESFENVDIPMAKHGKYLTVDCAQRLVEWLADLSEEHDLGRDPVQELDIACTNRMFLPKSAEKNSASPPPSSPTPPTSETGKASKSGKSKASAPSPETPENS